MTRTNLQFDQKITYMRRLLSVYVRFLKYYSAVDVIVAGKMIMVTYRDAKNNGYKFQSIEFPVADLGKRVEHYKQKVRTAFKNRKIVAIN